MGRVRTGECRVALPCHTWKVLRSPIGLERCPLGSLGSDCTSTTRGWQIRPVGARAGYVVLKVRRVQRQFVPPASACPCRRHRFRIGSSPLYPPAPRRYRVATGHLLNGSVRALAPRAIRASIRPVSAARCTSVRWNWKVILGARQRRFKRQRRWRTCPIFAAESRMPPTITFALSLNTGGAYGCEAHRRDTAPRMYSIAQTNRTICENVKGNARREER